MNSSILSSLDTVHRYVQENYVQQKRVAKERSLAKQLEYGFQGIVTYFKTNNLSLLTPSQQQIAQDLISTRRFPTNLFVSFGAGQESRRGESGFRFEQELGQFIQAIFETDVPIVVGDRKVTTGQIINITSSKAPPTIKVKPSKESGQKLTKQIEDMSLAEARKQGHSLVRLAAATGVIDLSIPNSQLQLSYEYAPITKNFLNILQGANITAKCYTNTQAISSGKTTLNRTLSAVVSEAKIPKEIDTLYYYLRYRRRSTQEQKEALQHMSHISFAYNVLGLGQYMDTEGVLQKLGETDYLIVFDKTLQTIRVRSTRALVYDYLQTSKSTARYPVIKL